MWQLKKKTRGCDLRKIINNELIIMLCTLQTVIHKWVTGEHPYFNLYNKSIKPKGSLLTCLFFSNTSMEQHNYNQLKMFSFQVNLESCCMTYSHSETHHTCQHPKHSRSLGWRNLFTSLTTEDPKHFAQYVPYSLTHILEQVE